MAVAGGPIEFDVIVSEESRRQAYEAINALNTAMDAMIQMQARRLRLIANAWESVATAQHETPDERGDDIDEGQAKRADDAFEFTPDAPGEPVSLKSAVYQALGAASVAWEGEAPQGIFDERRVRAVAEALLEVIERGQHEALDALEAERSRLAGIIRTAADALRDTTVANSGHDVALATGVERVRITLAEIDARGEA